MTASFVPFVISTALDANHIQQDVNTWFGYLKQGLSRTLPDDRIAGQQDCAGARANLQKPTAFYRPALAQRGAGRSLHPPQLSAGFSSF